MNVVYPVSIPRVINYLAFFLCCLCKLVLEKCIVQSHNRTIQLDKRKTSALQLRWFHSGVQFFLCDGCNKKLNCNLLLQSSSPCILHTQDMPKNFTVLHRPAFAARCILMLFTQCFRSVFFISGPHFVTLLWTGPCMFFFYEQKTFVVLFFFLLLVSTVTGKLICCMSLQEINLQLVSRFGDVLLKWTVALIPLM